MSDITGSGYGDKHDWVDQGTYQHYNPGDRFTTFLCRRCGAKFRHFYHLEPSIYEAIKNHGIKENCNE